MPELNIHIDEQFLKQIEHFAKRVDAAFTQPSDDPVLPRAINEQMYSCGRRIMIGLQQLHSQSFTSLTGRSYNAIRMVDDEKRRSGSFTNLAVSVGYFPRGDEARDTSLDRNVQVYMAGTIGESSIIGALLTGVEPGTIKAPRRGSEGGISREGWSRLESFLIRRNAGGRAVYKRKTKKWGEVSYKYRGYKQDIWAIVRHWELKGMLRTPLIEDFYNQVVPRELGTFRANVANTFRRWWETLGAK